MNQSCGVMFWGAEGGVVCGGRGAMWVCRVGRGEGVQ